MAEDKPEQGPSAQPVVQKAGTVKVVCNRKMRKRRKKAGDQKPYFVK